jgi:transmembrane sensor
MNSGPQEFPEEIMQAAAQWVLRLDRGLSAGEQDEYLQWLASDSRHGEAIAQLRWGWEELDRLAGAESSVLSLPNPDLLARRAARPSRLLLWSAPALVAAAALVIGVLYVRNLRDTQSAGLSPQPPVSLSAPCERRVLDDGSVVDLNRGAELLVDFNAKTRHVRLQRGEANFTVAKNPARPFVVEASGVNVQAVGTVFNVRLDSSAVEVLVSEGAVKVAAPHAPVATAPVVRAGQHALVSLARSDAPAVDSLSGEELAGRLAWQPRMLDFNDAPLSEIVAAFNAHNPVKMTIGDPALNNVRLSATFRSDNVEGFVRLMDSDFGMQVEWESQTAVVLRRK